MKKAREFWVYQDEAALVVRRDKNPNAVIEETHVIEYSEVERLKSIIAKCPAIILQAENERKSKEYLELKQAADELASQLELIHDAITDEYERHETKIGHNKQIRVLNNVVINGKTGLVPHLLANYHAKFGGGECKGPVRGAKDHP